MEWTFAENKAFENGIAELGLNCPNLVQQLALRLPGKTIEQIQMHFDELVKDVEMIELGEFDKVLELYDGGSSTSQSQIVEPSSVTSTKLKRKKGIPWTDEDHERFLRGLERYGKGDWKSISRNCVINKTPSQVASHAQKYFLKLKRHAKQHEAEPIA